MKWTFNNFLFAGYCLAFILNMVGMIASIPLAVSGNFIHITELSICFMGALYSLVKMMELE